MEYLKGEAHRKNCQKIMNTHFADYLSQGKSNNYLEAESEGKFKAGEVAKMLTKKFKVNISAKELECFSSEWHHAGVFKGYNGRLTGRRVKFFNEEQIEAITLEKILANREALQKEVEEGKQIVKGWYVRFERVSINRFGKLGWKPFVGVYKGIKAGMPDKFTELSDELFEDAKSYDGKQLIAYATNYNQIA